MHLGIVMAAGTSAPVYIGGAVIALLLVAAVVAVALKRRSAGRATPVRAPHPSAPAANGDAGQAHVPGVIHDRLRSFAQEIDQLPTKLPYEGVMAQLRTETPRDQTPEPLRILGTQPVEAVLTATHAAPEEARFVDAAASDNRADAPDAQGESVAYHDDSRFGTGPLAPLPPRSGR